jgi:hypothetical protein
MYLFYASAFLELILDSVVIKIIIYNLYTIISRYVLWYLDDSVVYMRDLILAHIWLLDLCSYKSGVTLTHQVSSLLSSGSSYLDNEDTCTLILLRNNGLDQKGRGIALAGFRLQDKHDLWWPRRLIKCTFQRIQNHLHICSESTAIVDLLQSPFQPWCCTNGSCIKLSPIRTHPWVGTRPQHPCGHSPTYL